MPGSPTISLPARPFVAFVIATYNRGPILLDCLARTLNSGLTAAQFRIAIVDNASTDNTPALLQAFIRQHPENKIDLIPLNTNRGPVAKNIAIQKVVAEGAHIVVLLDDDAYPLPGAVPQMIRHFQDDATLGAAVFDVTLPDGAREASAYPDVFIGAGTALRAVALKQIPTTAGEKVCAGLPQDFFMQAEEYDLSIRLLSGGWTIQRFWDMPLMHLKSPGARIGQRTTRLDVRNNLYLLARYIPEPLCHQLAADWLARYWRMALARDNSERATSCGTAAPGCDRQKPLNGAFVDAVASHRAAFIKGSAEGLAKWIAQRANGQRLISPQVLERLFKFQAIESRLRRARDHMGLRTIALADWGKNILAYHRAAQNLGLKITAVVDDQLACDAGALAGVTKPEYRNIPLIAYSAFSQTSPQPDALILTQISPVHARRRGEALRRVSPIPVIDLFAQPFRATTIGARPAEPMSHNHFPTAEVPISL